MLAAPLGSEKANANVCADPPPLLGETDTDDGGSEDPAPVGFQLPSCAHVLSCTPSKALAKMLLRPVNPDLKLNARFTVNVFPDDDTEEAPASSVHWLFCCVPALPIVDGLWNDPASSAR